MYARIKVVCLVVAMLGLSEARFAHAQAPPPPRREHGPGRGEGPPPPPRDRGPAPGDMAPPPSDRIPDELDRTDDRIHLAQSLLPESADPSARRELDRARELQSDARSAWANRRPMLAVRATLEARDFADRAIAMARGLPDPEHIGFQVERNTAHFMPWGKNPIDDADFRVSMETATRVLGMIKGEFTTTDGYMPAEQVQRMKDSGNVWFKEAESIRTFYFIINHAKAPLNDPNMRRALCCMFDYEGFNNGILGGTVVRNPGIIPNPMWGAPKDLKGYDYDIAKAKEHLAKVKAPLRPLSIGVLAGFSQSEQAAVLLQAGLAKIGVEAKLVSERS